MDRSTSVLWIVLAGCAGKGADDTADTGPAATAPCSSGWGAISDPDASIHVRSDGDDAGDGSVTSPLATLDAALALSPGGGAKRIAVGPGTYSANLVLAGASMGAPGDDGLVLEGCGVGETTIEAADVTLSVVQASAVEELEIAGLTLSGGTRTLRIDQGGTTSLVSIEVVGGLRNGVMMDGSYARPDVHAEDLAVSGILADVDGGFGYGIAVQDALFTVIGGAVSDTVGVGLFVTGHASVVTIADFAVSGVSVDADNRLGRGIHVQNLATASLTGVVLSGNVDAGLYALGAADVRLTGCLVESTLAGQLDDGTSGDGIVISRGADPVDPSEFTVDLRDTSVTGSARTGVLLDGVTAAASGNSVSGNGYSTDGILAQNGAVTSGTDSVQTLAGALSTNLTPLQADGLAPP